MPEALELSPHQHGLDSFGTCRKKAAPNTCLLPKSIGRMTPRKACLVCCKHLPAGSCLSRLECRFRRSAAPVTLEVRGLAPGSRWPFVGHCLAAFLRTSSRWFGLRPRSRTPVVLGPGSEAPRVEAGSQDRAKMLRWAELREAPGRQLPG